VKKLSDDLIGRLQSRVSNRSSLLSAFGGQTFFQTNFFLWPYMYTVSFTEANAISYGKASGKAMVLRHLEG